MAREIQAGTRFVFSTGADASSQYYYSYVTFFDIIDSFLNFGFFLCGKWITLIPQHYYKIFFLST